MKRSLLSGVVLVLALSAHAYGEDCNLEIRDGTAAQDLGRILQCFNQRMKNSEVEISDLKRRLGGGAPQVNSAEFDAGTLAVSVRGASRQNNALRVGLSVRNKTTERILLATNFTKSTAVLIDEETGASMNCSDVAGLTYLQSSNREEGQWTPILPNASVDLGLTFHSTEVKSRLFRLTLHLMRLKDKQVEQITVPLGVTLKGD